MSKPDLMLEWRRIIDAANPDLRLELAWLEYRMRKFEALRKLQRSERAT